METCRGEKSGNTLFLFPSNLRKFQIELKKLLTGNFSVEKFIYTENIRTSKEVFRAGNIFKRIQMLHRIKIPLRMAPYSS